MSTVAKREEPLPETFGTPEQQRPPSAAPWWIAGILLAIGVAAALFVFGPWGKPAPIPLPSPSPTPTATPTPLGGEAEAVTVPPLDESDGLVRSLVQKLLSADPQLVKWLATDHLIRTFVATVVNIAEGTSPASHLPAARPTGNFRTLDKGGKTLLDERSYDRYAALTSVVGSIDAAGSARLYATLRPRIGEAYHELGYPDASFDAVLEKAFVSLLQTPVVDGPISLQPVGKSGVLFGYTDPKLEELTAAQKHLLRMGPKNERMIQEKLRAVALALGIPAEHLPPTNMPR